MAAMPWVACLVWLWRREDRELLAWGMDGAFEPIEGEKKEKRKHGGAARRGKGKCRTTCKLRLK